MNEITIKHPGGNETFEIRSTREPFAPHTELQPGKELTIALDDSNVISIARKGVFDAPATSPVKEPDLAPAEKTNKRIKE